MFYMPIIKLKAAEIRLSSYIKSSLNNENIIPFLELIYEPDSNRKNTSLSDFVDNTKCDLFFLGIPHKKEVVKSDDSKKLITKANANSKAYFEETIKLFGEKNAIPVFYVYCDEDIEYANSFLKIAHAKNRSSAIITTTNYAWQLDQKLLTQNMYLMIDIGKDTLSAKRITIKASCKENKASIILVRENRETKSTNNIIKTDNPVPLLCDLSNEINQLSNKLGIKISGFGDFCGYKNVANTKGGARNRDKTFPGWAMYRKDVANPFYQGIRSDQPESNNGFSRLKELTLDRLMALDKKNPCIAILIEKNTGNYGPWNVITEWNYIYQMSKYDNWSELNASN